mmetsp:Transcript_2802/g.3999  ORF Transcript_2802/g.3999 Transcript_2802/m.3999 type:complete len:206 (-) Transcript_2802:309-926(-)
MLSSKYAQYHKTDGTVTSTLVVGDKLRAQTAFGDGTEMVEEFSVSSYDLISRRWRSTDTLGRQSTWEFEVGEMPPANQSADVVEGMMAVSRVNPSFHRRDKLECWEWRVRNLPYPLETYNITVEKDMTELVLRTTNRKYFKRWQIPFLVRLGMPLEEERISYDHENNTLIIQYTKPENILELEADRRGQLRSSSGQEGEADCKQS